ncbi:MAG: PA14 domain-containing protein [Gemmataceae bacterium]
MEKVRKSNFRITRSKSAKATKKSAMQVETLEARNLLAGDVNGLVGEYFNTTNLTELVSQRVDATIDFPNDVLGDDAQGLVASDDRYSIRWTGFVKVDQGGPWTFTTISNDGVRLWVDDTQVIDHWNQHRATRDNGNISLDAGWYPIRLEYFEKDGTTHMELRYSGPGQTEVIIPTTNLATSEPGATPNRPPTDVTLSSNVVAENATNGTVVGTLSAIDPDVNDTHTFMLIDNAEGRFQIVNNQLRVTNGSLLDYETTRSHTVQVQARDSDGATLVSPKSVTISVNNVNEAPTVSNLIDDVTVDEDAAAVTISLSEVFDDIEDSEISRFLVVGNTNGTLVSTELTGSDLTLSFAANKFGNATITIRGTDSGGLSVEDTFSVTVNAVNDPPAVADSIGDIEVGIDSADTVLDLSGVFTDLEDGTVTAIAVTGNTNSSLVDATFNGQQLILNYASGLSGTAVITIEGTDSGGLSARDSFTVIVKPDEPIEFGLRGEYFNTIYLTQSVSVRVDPTVDFPNDAFGDDAQGLVASDDQYSIRWTGFVKIDRTGPWTFTTISNDGVRLWVDGQQIINHWDQHRATRDRGTIALSEGWHPIRLEYFEQNGTTHMELRYSGPGQNEIIIPTTNLATTEPGTTPNQPPTDVALSSNSVNENAINGTVVGTLTATDPDANDTHTFTLTNNAGGRFQIVGNQLRVANGSLLDYETAKTHTIQVQVRDSNGGQLPAPKFLTITINDSNETPTADAGPDRSITLPTDMVTLDGSGSDEGSIVSHQWVQINGPSTTTLVGANAEDLTVRGLVQGTYEFQLMVTDNDGNTDSDKTTVTVAPGAVGSGVYQEAGGLVIIEAENTESNFGLWQERTDLNNFTGSGYLEFTGNQTANGLPNSPLEYEFKINKSGLYYLHMRAARDTTHGQPSDHSNDAYFRVEGDYNAGPGPYSSHGDNAALSVLKTDTKFFGGNADSFAWASGNRLDLGGHNNKRVAVYDFNAGETYKLVISGRSKYFSLDRVVFRHVDTSSNEAQDLSKPESERGGTGGQVSGELKKWHKISIDFEGPNVSETDTKNPFLDYRLDVTFRNQQTGTTLVVPGFYAADGDAANTSAASGNIWRVHFAPEETGTWTYTASFRQGSNVAVSSNSLSGTATGFDGTTGSFTVADTDKTGIDLRSKGRLNYVGGHYLQFAETGEYFLKQGADSPENLLAYEDFDNTTNVGGRRKSWAPHQQDYRPGDPSWQNGKGTEIIGAMNYLASEGLNAVSFIPMTYAGDDKNVFPWISTDSQDRTRFDVSKLEQWEVLFEHADHMGLFLHFKTQETENELLLDNGNLGTQRKMYYRELIARFGHHLALNWNLGEEINNASTSQKKAWAEYFSETDPYNHHIVIHNGSNHFDLMGPDSEYTGFSLQTNRSDFGNVHNKVKDYLTRSVNEGKPWAVAVDEPGDASHALRPDNDAGNSHEDGRKNALWGTFMAGGWGNEWYFGYQHNNSDLTLQNYRSRDNWWDYTRYALEFFNNNDIPFWEMTNDNGVSTASNDYGFIKEGEVYVVYLKNGGTTNLDLTGVEGTFSVQWFDPRNGGEMQDGTINEVDGGSSVNLGQAPNNRGKDWTILVTNNGINRAPQVINPMDDISVPENASPTEIDLANVFFDPEDATLTYSITSTDTNVVEVGVNGSVARLTYVPNTVGYAMVTVTATDSSGKSVNDVVSVTVGNVNFPPTDIILGNNSIEENSANGSVVGTLSVLDPDDTSHTFALTNDAGGRFDVTSSGDVIVRDGSRLDYEIATSHGITVEVGDGVNTNSESFTIRLINVFDGPSEPGLRATYFNSIDLTGVASQGVSSTINFSNDVLGDDAGGKVISDDQYSIRWEGYVYIENPGAWQFTTYSNDGVRLWVGDNDTPIIDHWDQHKSTRDDGQVTLEAGWHPIRLEYFQQNGTTDMRLLFSGPGQNEEIIPETHLRTALL